jgi:hypothetical protein
MTTETFYPQTNEWKIVWNTAPGQAGSTNFQIYVYDEAGNLDSVVANIVGTGNGESVIRGSGGHYLKIDTAQSYNVKIVEI